MKGWRALDRERWREREATCARRRFTHYVTMVLWLDAPCGAQPVSTPWSLLTRRDTDPKTWPSGVGTTWRQSAQHAATAGRGRRSWEMFKRLLISFKSFGTFSIQRGRAFSAGSSTDTSPLAPHWCLSPSRKLVWCSSVVLSCKQRPSCLTSSSPTPRHTSSDIRLTYEELPSWTFWTPWPSVGPVVV